MCLLIGMCIPAFLSAQNRIIHAVVALCDNQYQGIAKVPAGIGNGQSPATNLYWGAGYGVKTVFTRSKEWMLLGEAAQKNPKILQRLVFKHRTAPVIFIADAWDGKYIKECTEWFIESHAGKHRDSVEVKGKKYPSGGLAGLLCYIGHDGLMDFDIDVPVIADGSYRESIVLACYSKHYFSPWLKKCGSKPILWSTGLMAPEAYILEAALHEWVRKFNDYEAIRSAAAQAYSKYQKCSISAARRLLVTGY
ncbi:MAG: hypothetical protein RLZZ543_80 [Bacteroidota bacterium]